MLSPTLEVQKLMTIFIEESKVKPQANREGLAQIRVRTASGVDLGYILHFTSDSK